MFASLERDYVAVYRAKGEIARFDYENSNENHYHIIHE